MNSFFLSGHITSGPEGQTYNGKESVQIELTYTQFPGSRFEKEVPVRISARQDAAKAAMWEIGRGDFVAIEGEITWSQSKNNPEYWNPYFNFGKVITRVPTTQGVAAPPPTQTDTPF